MNELGIRNFQNKSNEGRIDTIMNNNTRGMKNINSSLKSVSKTYQYFLMDLKFSSSDPGALSLQQSHTPSFNSALEKGAISWNYRLLPVR